MYGCVNVFGSNTFGFLRPTAIQIKLITSYSITLCSALRPLNRKKIFLSLIQQK
jgi:hypothetical protein